MRPVTAARYAGQDEGAAVFELRERAQCRVYLLDEGLARVLVVRDGALKEPRTWSIAPRGADVPWEGRDRMSTAGFVNPRLVIQNTHNDVTLSVTGLDAHVQLDPFAIAWSVAGTTFARDRASDPYQWSSRSGIVRHYMARELTDRFCGLGDKTGPLDLHGRRLRTLALDALGYDARTSDPLYKHWPFVIGRDGVSGAWYGIFYDTLAPATFDLGCEYDNYHGFYRYVEIDDGDLDYYLFVGPTLPQVVRKFVELTGRMALPPRWSLGYANTAMSLTDAADAQRQLARFVDDAARHDVPLSAFHFGSGYSSIGKRRYVFTWNRDKFPAPREAIARFAQRGIRVVANIKPCLLDDHPAYAEVASRGGFISSAATHQPCISQFWDGHGAHVDFTHPAGIRWWQEGLDAQVLDYGIDAGWNDNNEYEIWDEDGQSHGFGQPIPIGRSRPLHALLMTRATAEAQARRTPDERVYTVTRAGPPGIQRYAQTWSGDNTTSWHTLRWNIRMGLTMSLSGMFNIGHDVGGFAGPTPDPELLVRWVQAGLFSPRFIMNSWKSDGRTNTPWLHPVVLAPIRDSIRLRYRLIPYLYTLFRRAATHGEPILRPLFYEFGTDVRAFDDTDAFMLGPSMLVAPVVDAGERRKRVYLPRGPRAWVDFWSGRRHAAGSEVVVDAPLERVPLLVPEGAIIPFTDALDFTRLHDEPTRQVRVFPPPAAGASRFVLYEDDGLSNAHARGQFAEVAFEVASTARSIEVSARRTGSHALPYDRIRVVLPRGERRPCALRGVDIDLHGPAT